jgi:hypothetical protein
LCDFLKEYENSEDIETYIYKDKVEAVKKILQTQTTDLANTNKTQILEKI